MASDILNVNIQQQSQLSSLIRDRASNIHRIDEDIEKLEQGIKDAERAIDGYRAAANDMQALESDVAQIFKGESALAFLKQITDYKNFCLERLANMETLKSNYTEQINQLKRQKVLAQNMINSLREHLEKLRRSCVT